MMIGNDHINAEFLCKCDLFNVGNTAIDRDKEFDAVSPELFYGGRVQSVTLRMPMRDIVQKIPVADLFQKVMQNDRTGDAVAVIVAVNNDAFAVRHRQEYAVDRTLHVEDTERIVGV